MLNYRKKIYSSYMSNGFKELNNENFDIYYNAIDQNYSALLPDRKDVSILDVGCGMGHFLYYLKKKGYTNFYGVDIGPEQIKFCSENVTDRVEHINDILKFIEDRSECFDVIIMNDVIEHFKKNEVFEILEVMKNKLTNDGMLILKTCNMGNIFSCASRYIDFTHEVGFTEISIVQVLQAVGFLDVNCYEDKLYINDPIKRPIFNLVRFLYEKIIKLIIYVDRPGDAFPKIISKNLIAVGKK